MPEIEIKDCPSKLVAKTSGREIKTYCPVLKKRVTLNKKGSQFVCKKIGKCNKKPHGNIIL